MELLKSPFLNDPSSLVAQAFAEIYPGTEYEAILVDKITTEDGTETGTPATSFTSRSASELTRRKPRHNFKIRLPRVAG